VIVLRAIRVLVAPGANSARRANSARSANSGSAFTADKRVIVMRAAADVSVPEHGPEADEANDYAPHLHINGNYTSNHLME
jgi:hypothetical protein